MPRRGPADSLSGSGSEEVHVQMSLRPRNPIVSPDDPMVVYPIGQVARAAERIRNTGRWIASALGLYGSVGESLPVAG